MISTEKKYMIDERADRIGTDEIRKFLPGFRYFEETGMMPIIEQDALNSEEAFRVYRQWDYLLRGLDKEQAAKLASHDAKTAKARGEPLIANMLRDLENPEFDFLDSEEMVNLRSISPEEVNALASSGAVKHFANGGKVYLSKGDLHGIIRMRQTAADLSKDIQKGLVKPLSGLKIVAEAHANRPELYIQALGAEIGTSLEIYMLPEATRGAARAALKNVSCIEVPTAEGRLMHYKTDLFFRKGPNGLIANVTYRTLVPNAVIHADSPDEIMRILPLWKNISPEMDAYMKSKWGAERIKNPRRCPPGEFTYSLYWNAEKRPQASEYMHWLDNNFSDGIRIPTSYGNVEAKIDGYDFGRKEIGLIDGRIGYKVPLEVHFKMHLP
ncbi:MAG: hypothetical protein J4431_02290 [Candidatus Aenigmarchaeota archaeon]|nr:hypothetical protein [Candidatus Aenigmarchaeota archaeon]